MRIQRLHLVFLMGFVVLGNAPLWADEKSKSPPLPASLAGLSDEGTFAIYKNEDRLVTITFKWQADGTFENKGVIAMAGQTVTQTMKVTPDKEGRWTKIVIESPRGQATFERKGDTARKTFK